MILGREPVAIAAVLAIAINLGMTFGLQLSAEQVTLINALVVGVLALIARQSVYSAPVTQKIADRAAATGNTDIGEPPSG